MGIFVTVATSAEGFFYNAGGLDHLDGSCRLDRPRCLCQAGALGLEALDLGPELTNLAVEPRHRGALSDGSLDGLAGLRRS